MLLPGKTTAQDVVSFTAAILIPIPSGGNLNDKIISFEYAEQNLDSSHGKGASSVEMADARAKVMEWLLFCKFSQYYVS